MQIYGLVVLFIVSTVMACTKKKEEPDAENPIIQESPSIPAESAAPADETSETVNETTAGAKTSQTEADEETKPATSSLKKTPRANAGLEVDKNIINQRIDTYQKDLMTFDSKLKKFLEVNDRFKGEAPDYEIDFDLAKEAFDQEKARFESLIANPLESPTRIQWENQERQWASEWMNLIRSFNDLEALYEKQYQGLK